MAKAIILNGGVLEFGGAFQEEDADLTALAALSTTGVLERTGAGAFATFTVSAFAKTLFDDPTASAARTTLGAASSGNSISAGTGLAGGGTLSTSRTLSLSAASQASLALADSATQPGDLATVATTGNYGDLSNRPTIPTVPTITAFAETLLDDASGAEMRTTIAAASAGVTVTAGAGLTGGGNLTANFSIALDTASQTSLGLADSAIQPGDLATVATTGSYNDLIGKPTISTYGESLINAPSSTNAKSILGLGALASLNEIGTSNMSLDADVENFLNQTTVAGMRTVLELGSASLYDHAFLLNKGNHTGLHDRIYDETHGGAVRVRCIPSSNIANVHYLIKTNGQTTNFDWNPGSYWDVRVDNTWQRINVDTSDIRFKKNISYLDLENLREDQSALSIFNQLQPIEFDWDEAKGPMAGHVKIGFSAQDVYDVEPELVRGLPTDPDDRPMSLNSSAIIPYLIMAIKELSTQAGIEASEMMAFKRLFTAPGDPLYYSIFNKVKAANDWDIFDHWSNFKIAIFDGNQRGIILGVHRLQQLLATTGYPLGTLDISGDTTQGDDFDGWNTKCTNAGIAGASYDQIPILLS